MPLIPSHRVFKWYRRTDFLLGPVQVAPVLAPSVDKCPQHDALIEVRIRGANQAGTVTLDGTVGGAPGSEVIVFDGLKPSSALQLSCTRGLCVTEITTTGFGPDTTIEARYVGSSGNGIPVNCLIEECVLGHREYGPRGTYPVPVSGSIEYGLGWIAFDDVYSDRPRPGDVFVELDETDQEEGRWVVIGRPEYLGALRRHHWELDVRLDNATDIELRPAP